MEVPPTEYYQIKTIESTNLKQIRMKMEYDSNWWAPPSYPCAKLAYIGSPLVYLRALSA